jgi:hypothetical protein
VTSNGADSLNRYRVGHQGGVRDDPHHPAVHADDEVVQPSRVAAGEQQRDRREEHEQPDQAAGEGIGLPHVPGGPSRCRPAWFGSPSNLHAVSAGYPAVPGGLKVSADEERRLMMVTSAWDCSPLPASR